MLSVAYTHDRNLCEAVAKELVGREGVKSKLGNFIKCWSCFQSCLDSFPNCTRLSNEFKYNLLFSRRQGASFNRNEYADAVPLAPQQPRFEYTRQPGRHELVYQNDYDEETPAAIFQKVFGRKKIPFSIAKRLGTYFTRISSLIFRNDVHVECPATVDSKMLSLSFFRLTSS